MKVMYLFGAVLTLVGMVAATPVATPTLPQMPDAASLAPRRNGYSDLPSSVNTCEYTYPSRPSP